MNNINVNARIIQKNDSEENWNKIPNFVPKKGQLIIYNPDTTHTSARIKIGDGNAFLIDLPFLNSTASQQILDHINNASIHVSSEDRAKWNTKLDCVIDGTNLIFSTTL